jgi:hypothetical protein
MGVKNKYLSPKKTKSRMRQRSIPNNVIKQLKYTQIIKDIILTEDCQEWFKMAKDT